MKILIIFILFSTFAISADTYVFHVNSPEMVEQYYLVFNAMKHIFEADSYISMLRFIFLVGGFIALLGGIFQGFTKRMNGAIAGYFKYIFVGVSLLVLLFVGKSDLIIKSTSIGSYCNSPSQNVQTISNFPTLLGFSFNYINRLGNSVTNMAEKEFTTVNSASGSITNGGYLHSVRDSVSILNTNLEDDYNLSTKDDLPFQMKTFFTQCMIVPFSAKGQLGEKELAKLKSNNNIYSYLESLYSGAGKSIGGINTKDYLLNVNGEIYTCGNYYNKIKPNLDEFRTKTLCLNKVDESALALIVGNTTPPSSSLQDVAMQAGLISSLAVTYNELGVTSDAVAYASGKTKASQVQENIANGEYMATMLPIIQSVLRIILFAFFPFVFIVVLFPGGLKVLGHYLKTLLWVELWTPVAAVLNMFLNFRAKDQMSNIYNSDGLTMINAIDMTSETAVIAGVAGYLYMTIPGLTWSFIAGTAMMIEKLGMAFGKGMMKNIRTESINLDIAHSETNKEMKSVTGDNSLSLAETQHFNAVSEGRLAGAIIGKRGQRELDLMSEISAGKASEKISHYGTVKAETGLGGVEQGQAIVATDVMKKITNINVIRENIGTNRKLSSVAINAIEAEKSSSLGEMKAMDDEKRRLTGSTGIELYSDAKKAEIAKTVAETKTLKDFNDGTASSESIDKMANTISYGEVASLSQTEAYTKNGTESKEVGRLAGENQNFEVKAKSEEQRFLQDEGGIGFKEVGQVQAKRILDTQTKQTATRKVALFAGGDSNNDGILSEKEFRKMMFTDKVLSTTINKEELVEKKDEEGNVIYDKDGNPEMEVKGVLSNRYTLSENGEKGKLAYSKNSVVGQAYQEGFVRVNLANQLQKSLNDGNHKYKKILEEIAHSGAIIGNTEGDLLLETIAHGEGTSDAIAQKHGFKNGYQITYGHGKYAPKGTDITKMTFAEIYALRKVMLRNQAGNKLKSTAMGKYQFTGKTLKEYQKKLGYSDDTKFTKEVQDAMGMRLLQDSGLRAYVNGTISKAQFQNRIAGRWASVARYDTGKSQYGQHTGTSSYTIQSAIDGDENAVKLSQMKKDAISRANSFNKKTKSVHTNEEIQHVFSNLEEAGELVRAVSPVFKAAGIMGGLLNRIVVAIADNRKKKKKLRIAIAKRKSANHIRRLKKEVDLSNKVIDKMMDIAGASDKAIKRELKKQDLETLKEIKKEAEKRRLENIAKAKDEKDKKIERAKTARAKQLRVDQKRLSLYSKKKEEIYKDMKKKEALSKKIKEKEDKFANEKAKLDSNIKEKSNKLANERDANKKLSLQEELKKIKDELNSKTIKHNTELKKMQNALKDSKYIKNAKDMVRGIDKRDRENLDKIKRAESKILELEKNSKFKNEVHLPRIQSELLKLDEMARGAGNKDDFLKLASGADNKEEFLKNNEKLNQAIIEKKQELLKEEKEVKKQLSLNEKEINKAKMERNFAKTKMISFNSEQDRIDAYDVDKEHKIKKAEEEYNKKVERENSKLKNIDSAIKVKEIESGKTKPSKTALDMKKISTNLLMNDNLTHFGDIAKNRSQKSVLANIKIADEKDFVDKMNQIKKEKAKLIPKDEVKAEKRRLEQLKAGLDNEDDSKIRSKLEKEIDKIDFRLEEDKFDRNKIYMDIRDIRKNRNARLNEYKALNAKLKELKKQKEKEAKRGFINNAFRKKLERTPIGKKGTIGKIAKHATNVATLGKKDLYESTGSKINSLQEKINEFGNQFSSTQEDRYRFLYAAKHSKDAGLLTNDISMKGIDSALKDNSKLRDSDWAKNRVAVMKVQSRDIFNKIKAIPGFDGKNLSTFADIEKLSRAEKALINKDFIDNLKKYDDEIKAHKDKILSFKDENKIQKNLNKFEEKIRVDAKSVKNRVEKSLITTKSKEQKKVYKIFSKKIKKAEEGMVKNFEKSDYYKAKAGEIEQLNKNRDIMNNIIGDVVEKSTAPVEVKDKINELFIELEKDNSDNNRKKLNKEVNNLIKSGDLSPTEVKTIESIRERAELFSKKSNTMSKQLKDETNSARMKGRTLGQERAIYSSRFLNNKGQLSISLNTVTETLSEWMKVVNKKTINVGGKTTSSVWKSIKNNDTNKDYYEDLMKKDTRFRNLAKGITTYGKMGGVLIAMAEAENQAKGISGNHAGNIVKHGLGMSNAIVKSSLMTYYTLYKYGDDSAYVKEGWAEIRAKEDNIDAMEERKTIMDKYVESNKLSDEQYASTLSTLEKLSIDIEKEKMSKDKLHKDILYVSEAKKEYMKYESLFADIIKQQEEATKDYYNSTWTDANYKFQDTLFTKAREAYNYIQKNVTEERYEEFKKAVSKINLGANSQSRPMSLIERDLKEEFAKLYMEAKENDALRELNKKEGKEKKVGEE